MAATNQVVPGPGGPSRASKLAETAPEPKLGCAAVRPSAGRSRRRSTLGVMRRHADQVCVVCARRRSPVKAISKERQTNRDEGARARPEGKIASVTIAGKPVICSRESNGLLVGRVSPPAVRQGPPRRAASKKPGESGSDEVKSHPFASERGTTGDPKTAPVGRFGISRLLRVRVRLEMRG